MLAVRALDAGGDPAGALAVFDAFRDRLARAARGDEKARHTVAAEALRSAQDGGYLVLVPRLRELARP